MGKWKNQVELCVKQLQLEYVAYLRQIDVTIREYEDLVRSAGSTADANEFLDELQERLKVVSEKGPKNPTWKFALDFLGGTITRIPAKKNRK